MILEKIKKIIAQELSLDEKDLSYPPNSDLGDISLALFRKAQEEKSSPNDLALKIKEDIFKNNNLSYILEKVEVMGAYLNFFVKAEYLIKNLLGDILKEKDKYAHLSIKKGETNIFEFSNVNTHKEFHIGHLRNIVLGDSICKIFQANGYNSFPVSYINDFGIHTAKTVWSYKKEANNDLSACYSQAVAESEKDPEIIKEFSEIMSDIEKKKGQNYRLWKKTRKISLNNFSGIYKKLKISFKKTYFESRVIYRGLSLVDSFLERGILVKSQGAIIANLEQYNLGVLPLIRSDGTALYPVADLALAEVKNRDFKNLKNSFIVVDVRQSLHFKQLFKVLSLADFKQKFIHLPYEFITLPEGKMSSRSGNSISFYELYDKVFAKLVEETKSRNPDWNNERIMRNCEKLSVAILKFEMLKVSANRIITFDINEATKFDGFNALYLLYSLVRIKSILKKANFKSNNKFDASLLNEKPEKDLALKMSKYGEILLRSKEEYDPSEIAKYLYELFKIFNDYYQKVKILSAPKETKKARLVFIHSLALLTEGALDLLGIEALKEI